MLSSAGRTKESNGIWSAIGGIHFRKKNSNGYIAQAERKTTYIHMVMIKINLYTMSSLKFEKQR